MIRRKFPLVLDAGWKRLLRDEFAKPYFKQIQRFLIDEYSSNVVFPPDHLIFNAFNLCPFEKVSVVILGQDPYHGEGQAHGLSFSVLEGVRKPPSLLNILKELKKDLDFEVPQYGNLEKWAQQGVFLLNAFLTVREQEPKSHESIGWGIFTNKVIELISQKKEGIVFLLWGNSAKQKLDLIDSSKHHVLTANHPSPPSANRGGFFGCQHFSRTNQLLERMGNKPIDWNLSAKV